MGDASPLGPSLSLTPISASGVYSPRIVCDCSLVTTEPSSADLMGKPRGIHDPFITSLSLVPQSIRMPGGRVL